MNVVRVADWLATEPVTDRERRYVEGKVARDVLVAQYDYRDCRLCMAVRSAADGSDLFDRRAVKAGDRMVLDFAGEDVHAWHALADLVAFRRFQYATGRA